MNGTKRLAGKAAQKYDVAVGCEQRAMRNGQPFPGCVLDWRTMGYLAWQLMYGKALKPGLTLTMLVCTMSLSVGSKGECAPQPAVRHACRSVQRYRPLFPQQLALHLFDH